MNDDRLMRAAATAREHCRLWRNRYEPVAAANHRRVADAFREMRVSQECFSGSTGYGYGDYGRDTLDRLWARIFGAQDALVRSQLVSGTHTLAVTLFGLLRPSDTLVSLTGTPYDTLLEVIGIRGTGTGSLREFGVNYMEIPGELTPEEKARRIPEDPGVVLIQRSRGYSWRDSLTIREISEMIRAVRRRKPEAVILVDNCYGEFVEDREPLDAGADVIAGSLIKNPGGGLAPTGGYIAGRRDLIEKISYSLTSPGIGREVGSVSAETLRMMYQGLYLAPHSTSQALEGAVFAAALLEELGYTVSPRWEEPRTDIVQAIRFGNPEHLIAFCQGIQFNSPVDAHVRPEPWDMPGYSDPVIMAAGTFVSGATSELSADGPLRPPYIAYMQGGLSAEYVKQAVLEGARRMLEEK